MKSTAEKTTRTATASIQRKAATPFFAPVRQLAAAPIQAKMQVNTPGDALEREADAMADRVVRMPSPPSAVAIRQHKTGYDGLQKMEERKLQRSETAAGVPAVSSSLQSTIQGQMSGGTALPSNTRSNMESHFNADFSGVRIHNDNTAASLNNQLSARAFTHQNHIFFSRDQYQPGTSGGQHLLAHELTHTVQQGHAIQRSPQVSVTTSAPPIQRLGLQDALDKFAGWANAIPGFRLLTFVMGFNPINRRSVDRSAANLLRALIELLPGGFLITQALDNHGVINRAAAWMEQKFAELGNIGGAIVEGLRLFMDSLSWTDIFDLGGVWDRAKRIFTEPIGRLISFGGSVVSEVLKMVKDAILKPLAALAQGTRGYDLLCAILGEDPISGQPVAASADNLLGGFMKLIGQEEIWNNIKSSNATARAWAWFQGALGQLMAFVRAIPGRIIATFTSLTFMDVVTVVGAFAKIVGGFAGIAIDFISWGLTTIWNLLEIIFDVVKPGLMGYIRRTGAALKSILRNPLPFLGNLVRAAKLGFENFSGRFTEHLKTGLIEWLTGSLEGVYIPRAVSLLEMGKFALSVLGITWAQIRGKIVRALGPNGERIMQGLETAFDVVKALVTGGIAAAWNLIKERLTDLKDQVMGGIISMVTTTIVQKAIPKMLSMFIPGAGFITAIISIYDTVMVFVEKISKIIQVVTAFIDSIVNIAAGNITSAAARVERVLGGLLSLAISFLAGFIGLGGIASKVMAVVQRIRASIDKAIDAAVNWVVGKARAFLSSAAQAGLPNDPNEKLRLGMATAVRVVNSLPGNRIGQALITPVLAPIKLRYGFQSLEPKLQGGKWYIFGQVNPSDKKQTTKEDGSGETEGDGPSARITILPKNSWVLVDNVIYQQVTVSTSVIRRKLDGQTIPVSFETAIPGKGNQTLLYSEIGKKWKPTNYLHGSKLIVPLGGGNFRLAPPIDGVSIRTIFYRDTYSSRSNIKNQRKASLMVNADEFRSQGNANDEASVGYTKKDPVTGCAIVPWRVSSADHDPPIAEHWSSIGGNNANQAAREFWNSSPATFKVMSFALNNKLGSRGANYTQDVGINFRGPNE